jgi:hypothetical protein
MAEKGLELAQEPAHKAYAAYALVRCVEVHAYPPDSSAMRSAESLYKLLGLIGSNDSLFDIQQEASTSNVLGFYEPEARSLS